MNNIDYNEGNWIKVRYKRNYFPGSRRSSYRENSFYKQNNFSDDILLKKYYKAPRSPKYMEPGKTGRENENLEGTKSPQENTEQQFPVNFNADTSSDKETQICRMSPRQSPENQRYKQCPGYFNPKRRWNSRKFETKPIMSYGIILFTVVKDSKTGECIPYFLLSQRRDTIEYVDFIRGQYTDDLLEIFFSRMSTVERERILKYSFTELWDDLWINKDQIHPDSFSKASCKYLKLQEKIPSLIENTNSELSSPPWGFPKGKRNLKETNMDCALREFSEETNIDLKEWNKEIVSYKPAIEIYKGSNGKLYGTNYFIIYVSSFIPFEKTKINGIRNTTTISDELGDLRWLSIDEASKVLNNRRIKLLEYVFRIVRKNGYL